MTDLQASVLREGDGAPTAGESCGSQGGRTGKSEGIENRSHRSKGLMSDSGCECEVGENFGNLGLVFDVAMNGGRMDEGAGTGIRRR